MLKFLIADDHPLFRDALEGTLKASFDDVCFVESDSLETTLDALKSNKKISMVLLDLTMPGCDNYYGLLRVKEVYPNVPIVVISASDSIETVAQVISFGATGFLSKTSSAATIKEAVLACLDGQTWICEDIKEQVLAVDTDVKTIAQKLKELTPKQFQVLRHVKNGLMNKEIAATLDVTEATVKAHIGVIFKKLDVKTRTQIVLAIEKLQLE